MLQSNKDDGTKYDSPVAKIGYNENIIFTFTVMSLFPFITHAY